MSSNESQSHREKILSATHHDPFQYLGVHNKEVNGKKQTLIRAFVPDAKKVTVIDEKSKKEYAMDPLPEQGFFRAILPYHKSVFLYKLRVLDQDNLEWEYYDPYQFLPVMGELDLHLFAEGNHHKIYEKMGAHLLTHQGIEGVHFSVWAPNAKRISLVGDFNNWDGRRHPMRVLGATGVWEIFVPGLKEGDKYKFEIKAQNDDIFLKTDPYGLFFELRPKSAAIVKDIDNYKWNDSKWMKARTKKNPRDQPMSIYEVSLHSWDRVSLEENGYLSYRDYADKLVKYVKDMGFTHIELMPIAEHPFDLSWGYQVTGFYAPTSRFGNPEDFMYFIDQCHQNNIGVILDWVPAHFPKDAYALPWFDGAPLYEHEDPRQGEHRDWGTLIFNFGRNEVRNFLVANVLFWFDKYHIDGVRVDAVSSMLYLDYCREKDDWIPNKYGGNENLDAIEFIKTFNSLVYKYFPGTITIAEESTSWPMVSNPTYLGGLGFGFKWNMGWMHDTLDYFANDPFFRKYHHNELTFSMMYAYSENFVLALSHDEVVHGKKSLLWKMPGDEWKMFANLRAMFAYMYGHPGKKLLFMGSEIGQAYEWYIKEPLHWYHLEQEKHKQLQLFMKDLNALYKKEPAFYEKDHDYDGFQWIDCHDWESSILVFARRAKDPSDFIIVACNFTPVPRDGYRVGVPEEGYYKEILNTDAEIYGGSNVGNKGGMYSENFGVHGQPHSLVLTLPPLSVVMFKKGKPPKK